MSGGEKRRLSIALELVANPKIFFLDEPTSGLDEVTAAQCIRLLKNLAKQGRTVVCTIHQPSATIFSLFDNVYVMARGQCIFQGEPNVLVRYLSYVNMECPLTYSPCDYIIELCDSGDSDIIMNLSKMTKNGKLICELNDVYAEISLKWINAITSIQSDVPPKIIKSGALLEKMKAFTKLMQNDNHAVSALRQFIVLFEIMMIKICRNHTVLIIQLIHHVMCGLFFGKFNLKKNILNKYDIYLIIVGLIFLGAADEGERMFDHLKFCIGIVFFLSYTQVIVPILACK